MRKIKKKSHQFRYTDNKNKDRITFKDTWKLKITFLDTSFLEFWATSSCPGHDLLLSFVFLVSVKYEHQMKEDQNLLQNFDHFNIFPLKFG